jgi:hypothetical protein
MIEGFRNQANSSICLYINHPTELKKMESKTQNFHPALTVMMKTVYTGAFSCQETWDIHA